MQIDCDSARKSFEKKPISRMLCPTSESARNAAGEYYEVAYNRIRRSSMYACMSPWRLEA